MNRIGSVRRSTGNVENIGRRERNKNKVWNRIISTSEKLFIENGFNATKIKEIVEMADCSTGTFFNYIRSKDDLLSCLTEIRLGEILGPSGMASIFDPNEMRLLPDAGTRIGQLEQIRNLLLIDLHYGNHFSCDVSCTEELTGWAECKAYVELLRHWQMRGLIRNDADILLRVMLLEGMVNAATAKWLLHGSNGGGSQLLGMLEDVTTVFREGAGAA